MKIRSLTLAIGITFATISAQAATYIEDFNAPFPSWESGWLGTNSNLSNFYGVGAGRGNNPDGLWIGSSDIQFNPSFGASVGTLDFDVASWTNGTIKVFDSSNILIASQLFTANQGAYSFPGTYEHFSFASTSGISHFEFVASGVVGNTSIDNVRVDNGQMVNSVPEPETYAMLLAGLGVMGTVARRRKAKQA